jgi:uncharacterized membrane protein
MWVRGTIEFERILFLSDAVVAIALTILVLDLRVPDGLAPHELAHAVANDWRSFLAFGLSFAVIANSWVGHHRFMSTIARMDSRLVWWNFSYLALIVLMPYGSSLISSHADSRFAVVSYLALVVVLTLDGMIGTVVAVRCRFTQEQGLTEEVRFDLLEDATRLIVFLLGIGIAFVASDSSWGLKWILVYIPAAAIVARRNPRRASRRAGRGV